ncbi:hypothetical protein MLDJOKPK_00021 [Salmonella phage SPAsTU]|nr:hypothetical protein STsAS_111 [Salmonella phage STsAS]AWN08985.1 hypothetical protein MLDJOKPK_00021 [Salmonella phage SPAsTU]
MFGVFRERNRLRHRVDVLELELSISKIELGASKEVWEKHIREGLETQRKLTRQLSELQSENRKLSEQLKEAQKEADIREEMLGWNLGALIYFLEQRWSPDALLKLLYEKLSYPGRRSAAVEYFRSHGYEVKK